MPELSNNPAERQTPVHRLALQILLLVLRLFTNFEEEYEKEEEKEGSGVGLIRFFAKVRPEWDERTVSIVPWRDCPRFAPIPSPKVLGYYPICPTRRQPSG